MTVTNPANKVVIPGNGATTVFTFDFVAVDTADIVVIYTDAAGTQTLLGTGSYGLALNPIDTGALWPVGGVVIYPLSNVPIVAGTSLTIARLVPLLQTISIQNQTALYLQVIERALDYGMMVSQQLAEQEGRNLHASITDPVGINYELPSVAARALQLVGFDAEGNVIAAQPSNALVSNVMQPFVGSTTLAEARAILGVIYSANDFPGVDPTGMSDSTVGINAVIAATPAGSDVMLAGRYLIGAAGLTGKNGVSVKGNGGQSAVLVAKAESFPSALLHYTDCSDFVVSGIHFDFRAATINAGSSALALGRCRRAWVTENEFEFTCPPPSTLGVASFAISSDASQDIWVLDNHIVASAVSNSQNQGIVISDASGTTQRILVRGNNLNGTGMDIRGTFISVIGNEIYGWGFGGGITFDGTAGVARNLIALNRIHDSLLAIDTNDTAPPGIESGGSETIIANNYIANCAFSGIQSGGPHAVITGNFCIRNGNAVPTGGINLSTSPGANSTTIFGNICYDDRVGAAQTQTYGLIVPAGVPGIVIAGNNFAGNKLGRLNFPVSDLPLSEVGDRYHSAPVAWTPGVIASGASVQTVVTVNGALPGSNCSAGFSSPLQGCVMGQPNCDSANSVAVSIMNLTGASKTIVAGTLRVCSEPSFDQ